MLAYLRGFNRRGASIDFILVDDVSRISKNLADYFNIQQAIETV
jgi:hypothetical protein